MPEAILFTPTLLDSHALVDVRTPLEFNEDHLPGAVNVPLLTNQERVEIGTIYKQQGAHPARMRALELTCGRFAAMVENIADTAKRRPILVYCWRGGLRSLSVTSLLKLSGYRAVQLKGGYKSYRNHVISCFEQFSAPAPLLVMHGMTGIGKTTFINRLDQSRCTSIDLEGIAQHRGSAFGSFGMQQNFSQKRFESLLWESFRQAPADRPIVLEGESKRIGKFSLPGNLYEVMLASHKIWCHASLATRVTRLLEEYDHDEYRAPMAEALERIRKKLGGADYAALKTMLEQGDMAGLATGLMELYYDKLYYKTRSWTAELELELEDFRLAEQQLLQFCETHL